jgi:hypothetical protein
VGYDHMEARGVGRTGRPEPSAASAPTQHAELDAIELVNARARLARHPRARGEAMAVLRHAAYEYQRHLRHGLAVARTNPDLSRLNVIQSHAARGRLKVNHEV